MNKFVRMTAVIASVAVGACNDAATAPMGSLNTPDAQALVGAPDPTKPLTWEGKLFVCKDGSASPLSFDFDYSVVRESDGVTVSSGTVSVPMGSCVSPTDVSTTATGIRYRATVTEHAVPANWALTGIAYAYGYAVNAPPTTDLAGKTISNLLMSNDIGVQVTFTNSYTPPPPPPPACTYTQGFWKTHQELWDSKGERVVTNSDLFFNSGKTYAEIYAMAPKGGNSYLQLAHQYIAAKLNVNGGSDPVINAAIAQAEALFAAHTAGSYTIKSATWTALATTLDNYNNGVTGPGHCG